MEGVVEAEMSALDCLLLYWERISLGRMAGGWTEERSGLGRRRLAVR